MILDNKIDVFSIKNGSTKVEFLPTGDIHQILVDNIMINQYLGNCIDGSVNNIYIRIHKKEKIEILPLLGVKSNSRFYINEKEAVWTGETEGIVYKITFVLQKEGIYFYEISLEGNGEEIDFIYGQDISLARKNDTLTNELYVSQYLDHTILKGKHGYVVSSRQNQEQEYGFPYIQQGSIDTEIVAYSTDAMQFFGKSYKETNKPEILEKGLPNANYQFEMAYIGMQTQKMNIDGRKNITFYSLIKSNYTHRIEKIDYEEELLSAYELFSSDRQKQKESKELEKIHMKKTFGDPFASEQLLKEELDSYFPSKKFEEYGGDKLLSFFTEKHSHVVMREKELAVERPHGHIILTTVDDEYVSREIISSTNYMYGIFNSHVVVGNTNMHKLISTARGHLNLFKNSGQRIYVKIEGIYHLLTLPAVYEMGMNYSRWFYKIGNDILTITSYSIAKKADIVLEVTSKNGYEYEFIITQQLVMGNQEYDEKIQVIQKDRDLIFIPDEDNLIKEVYPNLYYKMRIEGTEFEMSDDRVFFENNNSYNHTFLTISTKSVNTFRIIISGRIEDNSEEIVEDIGLGSFKENEKQYLDIYKKLMGGFNLSLSGSEQKNIEKINEILWWYTHNAMIHYIAPHGLEQPGGAAWGTRDVCQGPLEYFLSTGHSSLVREIIQIIFENQFYESGEWPQWFMYDKYNFRQYDCHGDVVFWPLKVVGDYIRVTGDNSILKCEVGYRHFKDGVATKNKESILDHIKRSICSIKDRYLYDTNLISYGGGDWDDTLQPANEELKQSLVSAWTVTLAYQVIKLLAEEIGKVDVSYGKELVQMYMDIKESFEKYLIKDGVIPGFVYLEDKEHMEYMLHPTDKKIGIQYRLLPMTRSIISELVDKNQAEKNIAIIDRELMHPDGVRLMNCPAFYKGGVSETFKRAEQASNVGREIGLQYVHAHIRYIEAMAKVGDANRAWDGVMRINPINISEKVSNAELRQSNCYFSSSDGEFATRYDFQENFEKLRTGDVNVKGGWRIYSSGPGIYVNQIITNLLGIRMNNNLLILDPVIPKELDNLKFDFHVNHIPVTFVYHINKQGESITKVLLNGKKMELSYIENAYRSGGCRVQYELLKDNFSSKNTIDIYIG
ncbi:cellobiose phosphorylase [Clostridium saccharoperbutylacetonicum]|uniref:Cellobiose phosphorylase n=2 Tax=Clostridium TaxID=1485 RepID=M1N7L6_9CLOT|nr:cellobiose phosphorylase [Clostridium saccharoperbutylacetonicum]AGF59367.1 cellobiose phosphorylase [Clostridium saccharoperbutylacetonicum N1-4(HMT)]NRT59843.1 cellobiose phosphorylase [Clostridium saccharoperbutylacetonicum]NSB23155.1 cellobiose phosphorylase [Clostridium saccharoperbutylacetonicum]NSB42525.1 cellobiose phosphorylase [Clostridium saccharoperbutylacetonicum]